MTGGSSPQSLCMASVTRPETGTRRGTRKGRTKTSVHLSVDSSRMPCIAAFQHTAWPLSLAIVFGSLGPSSPGAHWAGVRWKWGRTGVFKLCPLYQTPEMQGRPHAGCSLTETTVLLGWGSAGALYSGIYRTYPLFPSVSP